MKNANRRAGFAAAAAAAMLAAGCGSAAPAQHGSSKAAARAVPLGTSLASAAGTWATVVMGGSAAQHNNFWQLFIRPAGATRWKLVTPPGTADNGGLVLAAGSPALITAFRPSQYLTYTPLSKTSDGGQAWSALNPLDGSLASTPDALAMQPADGTLVALLTNGTAETADAGSVAWKTLTTERTLAATLTGRHCGLRALTAAAYTPSGMPLLAGTCSRPGTAGIFASIGGIWQAVGPAIPAALARQPITVLRLTATSNQVVALLEAGSGHAASLITGWSDDSGRNWALSPPLPLQGAVVASASFGTDGTAAVITTGGRAEVITSGRSSWHPLPTLPPGAATLAPGAGGQTDALAVHGSTLTIWQLTSGGSAWTKMQVISVPIQYGSSG